jgi:hypothetical protein
MAAGYRKIWYLPTRWYVLSIHITALFLAWNLVHTCTTLACIKNKKHRAPLLSNNRVMMMSSWFEIVELNAHTLPAALTITTSCLVYLKI